MFLKYRFPSETYPVLAFIGPPSSFPVRPENRVFHRYLEWNSHINLVTENFINRWLNKPVVGVHLRNGEDFVSCVLTYKFYCLLEELRVKIMLNTCTQQ